MCCNLQSSLSALLYIAVLLLPDDQGAFLFKRYLSALVEN
jgi:hypothetical protein